MKQNKKKNRKIITAVFLSAFALNMLSGAVFEKTQVVYAAANYTGYSSLLSKNVTRTGTTKVVSYNQKDDASVFDSYYRYSDADYFGDLPYASGTWVGKEWGNISQKTVEKTNGTTTKGEKSILPNGDFKLRVDGSSSKSVMPLGWNPYNITVWRAYDNFTEDRIGVISNNTNSGYLESDRISVGTGRAYTVSFNWIGEANIKGAAAQYFFRNSAGTVVGSGTLASVNGNMGRTYFQKVITAPTGASTLSIRLINSGRTYAGAPNAAVFFYNVKVVDGNLTTKYGNLFSNSITYNDGEYSGNIDKKANSLTWTDSHGETNRVSPEITETKKYAVSGNLFSASANVDSSKASKSITYYDPVTGQTLTGTAAYTAVSFVPDSRTYKQVNGTGGKTGFADNGGSPLNMGTSAWTGTRKVYRGYESRGEKTWSSTIENNLLRYATTGLNSIGGTSSAPQFAYYSSSNTWIRTPSTDNITYYYDDPPRINNDTGYAGYGAVFDGLKNAIKYNGNLYHASYIGSTSTIKNAAGTSYTIPYSSLQYPFIRYGGTTTVDPNTNNYMETNKDMFDYGWVMIYYGWSPVITGVRSSSQDTNYAWNESGAYRKFVNATYAKTHTKDISVTYKGRVNLPDIAEGDVSINQTYRGTVYKKGYITYNATPTYTGTTYQRIKGAINKPYVSSAPRYEKYEDIHIHDIQTYDLNVGRVNVSITNQSGSILGGLSRDINKPTNTNGHHKQWPYQTFNLNDSIPDTPAGEVYYARVRSYNTSGTLLKTLNIPFVLRTDFEIDQPTISSKFLYIGEEYTINVSGPRITNDIVVKFPFSIIAPNGAEYPANTDVTVPLTYNSTTQKKSGSYTFKISETQPSTDRIYTVEVEGTSITDGYKSSKYLNNIHLRIVRIIGMDVMERRLGKNYVDTTKIDAPVAVPVEIKAGYKNKIQVEHRKARILELEFYKGNTPISDVEFFVNGSHGSMIKYSGIMTDSDYIGYTAGDNQSDHKVTILVSNPNYSFVDVGFIIPQVRKNTNVGDVLSVKIKAYDEYGYIINNALGYRLFEIVGSEKLDREGSNNIR